MTDTLEAVQLAICLDDNPDQIGTKGSCEGGCIHPAAGSVCAYRSNARAAITTLLERMREPSEAMKAVVAANWGRRTWAEYQAVVDQFEKETLADG